MAPRYVRAFTIFALVLATFSGRVIDEGNLRALDGVRVQIDGPSSAEATTDKTGHVTLTNLKPGPYTITTDSQQVPVQQFHITLVNNRTTVMEMRVCSTRYDAHCGPPPRGLP